MSSSTVDLHDEDISADLSSRSPPHHSGREREREEEEVITTFPRRRLSRLFLLLLLSFFRYVSLEISAGCHLLFLFI